MRGDDVDAEIEFHLAEVADGLVASGWTREAAEAEARRRFGDRVRYRRGVAGIDRRGRWRSAMRADVLAFDIRQAIRSLRAAPAFTAAALGVLVLGIGATTAIFSIVDAVVLRPLPFVESERLVAVGERRPGSGTAADPLAMSRLAPQNYADVAAMQRVFSGLGVYVAGSITLQRPGADPEDVSYQRVTSGLFDVFGERPVIGRGFDADHEIEGRHFVAVLSDALWRRRFGADPAIVGRTIMLDQAGFEVIGVMPHGFAYPVGAPRPVELWVPYFVPANERTRVPNQFSLYLQVVARLRPGAAIADAEADMARVSTALEAAHPAWNKDVDIAVRPLRDHLVGARVSAWMLMLLGAVAIVLVIACANVASLFLTRAASRRREIGIRAALGAGRWRIVRQLVVEGLVLSIAGAGLAVLVAWWLVGLLKHAMPDGVARVASISLDARVLAVSALISIATGLLFALAPALQLSRPDLGRILAAGRGSTPAGRDWLRRLLVVAEIALAVVLLVGAALFIGSFSALMRVDTGLTADRVLLVQLAPRTEPGRARPDLRAEYQEVVSRIASAPGVIHAGMILGGTPLSGSMSTTQLVTPGAAAAGVSVSFRRVTPDYFRALDIALRRGRWLSEQDRDRLPRAAILNESAASAYFGGVDPIGASITLDDDPYTVVGVVADVVQTDLETAPRAEAFVPVAYGARNRGDLVIRTAADPYDVLPYVRQAMRDVLPDMPLRDVRTMAEVVSKGAAQRRLNMLVLSLFGLVGLVIAAVGVYGVIAQFVADRRREIGLRMALGASRALIVFAVLRSAAGLVLAGLAIGGTVAWVFRSTMTAFLFRLEPGDPRAYLAAVASLALVAIVAALIPARRAASIDPATVLAEE
ncbi:MAG TPA: ABC transporter permease [Vicinamibacterales bacterium]|nr:ABC transporter permease [Vicinamibacterales bacterium]